MDGDKLVQVQTATKGKSAKYTREFTDTHMIMQQRQWQHNLKSTIPRQKSSISQVPTRYPHPSSLLMINASLP
ncbi:putative lipocalin/fatty-acid binding family protein-like [Homarus americanus]|uniref:Putative lipocalin/fatty-acid binding family protein-like n=1 Tax=Homarus americanus TaxID=6706 RepID=A0A8J5K864_HOMAM|nr:putative lipocalin/fatty-acid binding family protein-like [Homarus americanus]